MLKGGQKFNNTQVTKEDITKFDEEINQILKPFNVFFIILRTRIVNMLSMVESS